MYDECLSMRITYDTLFIVGLWGEWYIALDLGLYMAYYFHDELLAVDKTII